MFDTMARILRLKRLELLLKLKPQAKLIWTTYMQDYPIVPYQLEAMRLAAANASVILVEVPATSLTEIESDLKSRTNSDDIGVDAVFMMYEPLGTRPDIYRVISKFAKEHRIPTAGGLTGWVF